MTIDPTMSFTETGHFSSTLRRVDAGHAGPGGGLNGLGVLPGTLVEADA